MVLAALQSRPRPTVASASVMTAFSAALVRTATENLLTYALGRGVEYYDAPAIRAIVREAALQDYRWWAIVRGIVASTPFQMRRVE